MLQEEARIEQEHLRQSAAPSPPAALTVNRLNSRSNTSFNRQNSQSSSTPRNNDQRCPRPVCQLCTKPGHEAIDCWQRSNQTDYPSRRPNPRTQYRQAHMAQHNSPSTVVDPSWYFDTGATDLFVWFSLLLSLKVGVFDNLT